MQVEVNQLKITEIKQQNHRGLLRRTQSKYEMAPKDINILFTPQNTIVSRNQRIDYQIPKQKKQVKTNETRIMIIKQQKCPQTYIRERKSMNVPILLKKEENTHTYAYTRTNKRQIAEIKQQNCWQICARKRRLSEDRSV